MMIVSPRKDTPRASSTLRAAATSTTLMFNTALPVPFGSATALTDLKAWDVGIEVGEPQVVAPFGQLEAEHVGVDLIARSRLLTLN